MIRGATAPTAGSAKWGSRVGQPARVPVRSRRRRRPTRGVPAARQPVFRAAAGPRGGGVADDPGAGGPVDGWVREPSSTTMTGAGRAEGARVAASPAARSRTGITTVTSPAAGRRPAGGRGWAMPASRSRRARACAPGLGPTGCPAAQASTCAAPAGRRRRTRMGAPADQDSRPGPADRRVEGQAESGRAGRPGARGSRGRRRARSPGRHAGVDRAAPRR